jgi:hypothetical protein
VNGNTTSAPIGIARAILGWLPMTFASLAWTAFIRDLIWMKRFEGYISDYNAGRAIFDGAVVLVIGGLGYWALSPSLEKRGPRYALRVLVVLMTAFGLAAGQS